MPIIYPSQLIDKFYLSFYIILSFICISSTLIYYEYQRRENFYKSYQLKIQQENTNKILNNLPLGIIVTENQKIIDVNQTFKEIIQANSSRNNLEERNQIDNENDLDYHHYFLSMTEYFKRSDTSESLKNYIVNDKVIERNSEFNLCNEVNHKLIPFEITTTKIDITHGIQIIYTLKNMAAFHELNEMKSKQKYSRMFLASISHDFRTNLNIILGNLDIYCDGLNPSNKDNCFLKTIQNSVTFLSILVQDLIDFSLIKEKKLQLNLSKLDIIDVVEQTCHLFESKFKDKRLFLRKEISENVPKSINSDKMKITQILTNLLSNSLKFTISGGVFVSLEYQENEKLMIITVKDTGIGIDEENIPKLMKPFSRLEDNMHLNENGFLN